MTENRSRRRSRSNEPPGGHSELVIFLLVPALFVAVSVWYAYETLRRRLRGQA